MSRWRCAASALVCGGLIALSACGPATLLIGTSLGKQPAPGFQLRDSGGQGYSLAQFRGKVVVLSFLYTSCPDYCPLTAELLRNADELAGHPANVIYLAVTVDPIGDTPANIAAFEQNHSLGELGSRWHYLVGDPAVLDGVWRAYGIGVSPASAPTQYTHTTAIYLIDKQGGERSLLQPDTAPSDLAHDLRTLVAR